jgi:hypothetical protein
MKKSDIKYRQGRTKDKQSVNEKIVTYIFIGILIMLLTLIVYNLSLSL